MTRTSNVPALNLRNTSMTFPGPIKAVKDVSLEVQQQEVVALLGPNGAGKTTLFDMALGLQQPTEGSAELLGFTPSQAKRRGLVGAINQTGSLPSDYRVGTLLTMFQKFYNNPLSTDEVMKLTNLNPLKDRRIGKLSGGEQQRVRLALALLPDPLVLFLDEPTAGMDPEARQEFWRIMKKAIGHGKTIIFATHYLAEAESFAERTVIMGGGQIVADAPTAQLLQEGVGELQIDIPEAPFKAVQERLVRPGWDTQWNSGTVSVRGQDLDDAARILLGVTEARNLRISDSSMEDVFSTVLLQTNGKQLTGSDVK